MDYWVRGNIGQMCFIDRARSLHVYVEVYLNRRGIFVYEQMKYVNLCLASQLQGMTNLRTPATRLDCVYGFCMRREYMLLADI